MPKKKIITKQMLDNFEVSMCFPCVEKTYGNKPKRDVGAITVSMGDCPVCKEKVVPIMPASDIYYAYHDTVTSEDWD